MYYVYIIKDKRRGSLYIGFTGDIDRRLKEHKLRNPDLIYFEAYKNEKDARDREIKLKQRGQAIRFLKMRIQNSLTG